MSAALDERRVVAKMWPLKRCCFSNGLRAKRIAEVGGRTYLYRVLFVGGRWRTERQAIAGIEDERAYGALVEVSRRAVTRTAAENAIWTDFEELQKAVN